MNGDRSCVEYCVLKYLFLLGCSFAVAGPVLAQQVDTSSELELNHSIPDEQITVVATGARITLAQTGQSITVIDEKELHAIQGPDLSRVLERAKTRR